MNKYEAILTFETLEDARHLRARMTGALAKVRARADIVSLVPIIGERRMAEPSADTEAATLLERERCALIAEHRGANATAEAIRQVPEEPQRRPEPEEAADDDEREEGD